jgi:ATP adenylyltransferase
MSKKEILMNMQNARKPHQKKQMEEILEHGICPFCRKYFEKYHREPILREKKHWLITKNDYPYDGAKIHFLFVLKKHKTKLSEIGSNAIKELENHFTWIEKKFKIPGGTVILRFGDIKYTGATISHLHGHIVVGEKQRKKTEPIKVKIGFKK